MKFSDSEGFSAGGAADAGAGAEDDDDDDEAEEEAVSIAALPFADAIPRQAAATKNTNERDRNAQEPRKKANGQRGK